MRKLILIAAMTLLPAAAMAGQSRGLSMASTEPSTQATTEQPKAKADTPVAAVPQEPTKTPNVADKPDDSSKVKKRHVSTEARIIYELHRHGIYW
jgi:hypothetical protein